MKSNLRLLPYALRPCRGFTLVEVLVVITIIVVLAGLGFVGLTRARASAYTARDITKLREIAVAITGYTADSNGRLPVDRKYDPDTWIPEDLVANTKSYCRFELIDRYLSRDDSFGKGSWYSFQHRVNSPWTSDSARPYPGWQKNKAYPELTGPIAFAFNPNIENQANWKGYLSKVPDLARYVVLAEQNDQAANNLDPSAKAQTENNVKTRYRVSHPGGKGLYLFADGHIESLMGDRSYRYFAANPNETNIWKWWK